MVVELRRMLAVALLVVIAPVAATAGNETRLGLFDVADGALVWSLAIPEKGRVTLTYEHSLYRVEQAEIYVAEAGGLRLVEMRFGSYDALAYYDPDGELRAMRRPDGWRLTIDSATPIRPSPFRVGYRTDHRLEVAGTQIHVSDFIASGLLARLMRLPRPSASAESERRAGAAQ